MSASECDTDEEFDNFLADIENMPDIKFTPEKKVEAKVPAAPRKKQKRGLRCKKLIRLRESCKRR